MEALKSAQAGMLAALMHSSTTQSVLRRLYHHRVNRLRANPGTLSKSARTLRNIPPGEHASSKSVPSPEFVALMELFQMNILIWRLAPVHLHRIVWNVNVGCLSALFPYDDSAISVTPATGCPVPGSVWIRSSKSTTEASHSSAVLFVHGGGYTAGKALDYATFCGELSSHLHGAQVLSLEYEMAPDSASIFEQTDSVMKAFEWLASLPGLSRQRIILCGDSAGGGLVALALQKLGKEQPAAAVLVSPWLDLEATAPSIVSNESRDPGLSVHCIKHLQKELLKHPKHFNAWGGLSNPRLSALHGEWSGLCPLYIYAADAEMLRDDATRAADRARAENVHVVLDVEHWAFHETPVWCVAIPEGTAGMERIAAFCRGALGLPTERSRL